MSGRGKETALALLGLAGFGAVVTVFGALQDDVRPNSAAVAPSQAMVAPKPEAVDAARPAPAVPPAPAPPAQASVAPAAPPPAQAAPAGPPRPSFDIVRVEPSGDSVIAGRAAPGAAVELLRDGVVHDRAVADASGQFAFVAPPLPTGPSQLSLRMPAAEGTPVLSEQSVTVVVAPRRDESPVVALASPDRPTAILSAPAASPPSPAPSAAPAAPPAAAPSPTREAPAHAPVRVEAVEAEDGGKLYVSGRAAPGTTVRLYLNETLVASGPATPEGRISFSIERGVAPGDYRVRLDEAEAGTGTVRSRAQVAFAMPAGTIAPPVPPAAPSATRPPAIPPLPPTTAETARPASPELPAGPPSGPAPVGPASRPGEALTASAEPVTTARSAEPGLVVVPRVETATVSRGDSLWRISRRIYGSGMRYTVIYDANQEQIRDPNRIYPGQLFVLPGDGAPR